MRLFLFLIVIIFYISPSFARWQTCKNFSCPEGTSCEIVGGFAVCVTDRIPSHHSKCSETECPKGYKCHSDRGLVSEVLTCSPINDICENYYCPRGSHCFAGFKGIPRCFDDDKFPQLCKVTECPPHFSCHMVKGNPTCVLGSVPTPTPTPTTTPCPTCRTTVCGIPHHRCVMIPNPITTDRCRLKPICIPIPSTSSTTGTGTSTTTTTTSTTGGTTSTTTTTGTASSESQSDSSTASSSASNSDSSAASSSASDSSASSASDSSASDSSASDSSASVASP